MTEAERNKQIAHAFFGALTRSDVPAILSFYADDVKVHTMGNTLISGVFDKAHVAAAAHRVLDTFPKGVKFTIKTLTAEDDRVAIEAESRGEHVSGKTYANQYHFLMRVRDGKITEFKEYMDTEMVTDILCGGQRRQ